MDRAAHSFWNATDVARLLALVENERRYFAEIIADLPVAIAVVSADLELLLINRAFRTLFQLKRTENQLMRLGGLQSGAEISEKVHAAFTANQALESAAVGSFHISLAPYRCAEEPGNELLLVVQRGVVAPPNQAREFDPADYDAIFWRRSDKLEFESISPQLEEILGYTPDQFMTDSRFWIGTVHPIDRKAVQDFYGDIKAEGRYQIEYRAFHATGGLVRLRDAVLVRMGRMTGMTMNVSNSGLIENDHLQSEKFESLSRLARRVTHDFNNLHMVIKGFGGDVLDALPPEGTAQSDLGEIIGAAERLATVVEKLEMYIRRPALVLAQFDINRFIENFVRGLSLPAGIETTLDLHPSAALVMVDADNFEKILSWLFTLDAGGRLRIATSTLHAAEVHADKPSAFRSGEYTELSVQNSGTPIDPVASESILLRAHTVMRLMGGGFESFAADRGNRFQFLLPSATDAPPPPAQPLSPGTLPEQIPSKTVLVVEDEPGIRMLIRKMLLRSGYQVLEAQSGKEGLQIAKQSCGKIDLLITDLMMPQMNGRELVEKMLRAWPQTKVVFISGFTDDPLLDRAGLPAGVVFLQKPFTLESLLEKVDAALAFAS